MRKIVSSGSFFLFIIFFLAACSHAPSLKGFHYTDQFLTSEQAYLNDIPQREKALESFTDLRMNDSLQHWTKKVFVRYYERLDQPYAFVFDTIDYEFIVNPAMEIMQVKNWKYILKKIKKRTNSVLDAKYTKAEQAKAKDFVVQIVLDSTLIMNKNTLDISLINLGIRYFTDPDFFNQPAFKTWKRASDRIDIRGKFAISQAELNYSIFKLLKLAGKKSTGKQPKIKKGETRVFFIINPVKKQLIYAEQLNRIKYEENKIEFKVTAESSSLKKNR